MNKGIFCVWLLIGVLGVAVRVTAAPGNDLTRASTDKKPLAEVSYIAPYPFTADELWEKILKVAAQPEGYVAKEQVDNIFGTSMKLNDEFLNKYHEKIYSLIREKDWYFNMSVGDNKPARSLFFFSWGDRPGQRSAEYPPPPPPGMCINTYKIRPSLQQLGWALRREARGTSEPVYSDSYRKGRIGVLTIEFLPADNCLRTIKISASRSEAEEYPVE